MMAWKNFPYDELKCPCGCERMEMDTDFMDAVQRIRTKLGFPFEVLSAYRCPEYNAKISKTGRLGPHTTGKAMDVKCSSYQRMRIVREALREGWTRFGVNRGSLHFDGLGEADEFPSMVMWDYYPKG